LGGHLCFPRADIAMVASLMDAALEYCDETKEL
jgi:hypothetical protein